MPELFRIKICGVTHINDVDLVAESGADAIGLNFFRGSKRYVDPITAVKIADQAPASLAKVGVFVNETVESIQNIARDLGLDWIQLHGDEEPEMIRQLKVAPIVKAFRLNKAGIAPAAEFLRRCAADQLPDAILLDAYHPTHFGGTGLTLDWSQLAGQIPLLGGVQWILAGGLKPDNVTAAIEQARPWAVDTASGVEATQGRKDAALTRLFVSHARAAFQRAV